MPGKRGKPLPRGGIVLIYHRTAEVSPDPFGLCVSPDHFSEHLEVISSHYAPISLREMGQAVRGGDVPQGSVAVTFDDGYADNLSNAKPLLLSHEIPAAFFVALGYVESQREFWWDELHRYLLESQALPAILELKIGRKGYRLDLAEADRLTGQSDPSYWNWKVWEGVPTQRHQAYVDLHAMLRSLPPPQRGAVLGELGSLAGIDEMPAREAYRPLDVTELGQLDRGDLVEVGAHTITHSVLANLSPEAQVEELEGCKGRMEEILNHRIGLLSYPFGGRRDFTSETVRVAKKAGFVAACSGLRGRVTPSTDPYRLPRFLVFDWDGEEFARRLEKFFRWRMLASMGWRW